MNDELDDEREARDRADDADSAASQWYGEQARWFGEQERAGARFRAALDPIPLLRCEPQTRLFMWIDRGQGSSYVGKHRRAM